MFSLEIKTDNAAFSNDDGRVTTEARGRETARILRKLADQIEHVTRDGNGLAGCLFDLNGNRVGEWGFDESVEDEGEDEDY